jgi:dihydroorotate dehydrogenase
MIFEGPWVAKKINHELADLLRNDGFKNVADAIGASV